MDIILPNIGDIDEVEVIEVCVAVGDMLEANDTIIVVESDKASMEIPAPSAGVLAALQIVVGDQISEGQCIATLTVNDETKDAEPPILLDVLPSQTVREVVTGDGPAGNGSTHDDAEPAQAPDIPLPNDDARALKVGAELTISAATKVYAGPAVRRLARELGVDLALVMGTGSRDRITKDDVKLYVKTRFGSETAGAVPAGGGLPQVAVVDYAKFGPTQSRDLTRIQRLGAVNLHRSWVNLPHVTQHDEADITDLETFRHALKAEAERKGVKVTPLAFMVKACCCVLKAYPMFNASLHESQQQLILKHYYNIGMAVDTPEGLVVPVIRNADQKSIWELSAEIADLSARAREKKLAIDELQGGTFSISSLGALGGTGFTPIVNAPEVAILGVSKLATQPVWDGAQFQPRKILPLSLSYDHRVVNGADGGRFMVMLTALLGDIRRLAL